MSETLPVLAALLAALAISAPIARRLRISEPIVLALVGLALAFVPGLPRRALDPELILVVFLPPILYADAFHTSWVDFQRWLRPILMLAIGLVALTILVVGIVAHALLPELPWAVCFVIGAIVSPTDTVAVQSVIEKLRVPRRTTAILGGESLVNDATGLVGVQIGVAVVLSGAFEAGEVAMRFATVAGGGIVVGLVIGLVFSWLNRVARSTELLFTLSLLSPYLAYWIAHEFEASGVLAVVVAGFLVAWRIHLIPAEARIQLYSAWGLMTWALNGLSFIFIGLEAPRLVRETEVGTTSNLLVAGLVLSAVVILVRIAWVFPGAYLPLLLSPALRKREGGFPPVRGVLLVSWCGVRGVISLAAALAIPVTLDDGTPFPGRQAMLACVLCVILVTLFVQGLTLGPLVRLLGIRGDEDSEVEVRAAREAMLEAGIRRLDAFCSETSCPLSVHHWRTHMADELVTLRDEDKDQRDQARARIAVSRDVRRAVADEQASELLKLRDSGRINDRTYLQLQLDLDRERHAGRQEEAA
ncbi:MAG: Na+/H+ antiporter [Planctomycetota bacterium]|nr:Na+/H+ antiporter [Planctomycetota bacterium]